MRAVITLFTFFLTLSSFSQKNIQAEADKLLNSDNFHNFKLEKFFLHTNKSIYFAGEKIWFKAYVVDDDFNVPYIETSNLHLNLYDSDKLLINSKLLYVDNGISYGEIELSKDLKSGIYFLQLDTQWNRNFKNGTIFKIEVKNLKVMDSEEINQPISSNNQPITNETKPLGISFFPESQTMLKNVQNMVSFSTLKNITGKVIDDISGLPVASLRSNELGVGAFKILYNSSYSVLLDIDGEEVKIKVPNAVENGFVIHKRTSNYNSKTIHFEFKTNKQTIKNLDSKYLFAVLHRNGSVRSVAPIELKKEIIDYTINFLSDDVFNGINTITLFNEQNQPISERHFFWKRDNTIQIEVTKQSKVDDSLNLSLRVLDKTLPTNLSISVLPEQTQVYKDDYSIVSSFLASPYINGSTSYINNTDLSNSELDFLIQTKTFKNSLPYRNIKQSELLFQNDNGITLKGSINTKINDLEKYSVMLTSKENNLLLVQPLEKDKTFEFSNLLLNHPTNYQLALLNKKGEIEKATFFVYKTYTDYVSNTKLIIEDYKNNNNPSSKAQELNQQDFDLSLLEFGDVEELDEIVIKADRVKAEQEIQKKLRRSGVQGMAFSNIYKIDESSFAKGDIIQFLRTLSGITVKYTQDNTPYLNNERYLKTFNNIGDAPLTIVLDGTPLGTDLTVINFRQASEFEYIIVNHRGAGYGALYPKGVINMVTKKGNDGKQLSKENPDIQVSDTEFGFSIPEANYTSPFFQFPSYGSKENFNTLDWIPNFEVLPNKYNSLKVNVEDSNGVKLIINGMNNNGDLIYEVITIN